MHGIDCQYHDWWAGAGFVSNLGLYLHLLQVLHGTLPVEWSSLTSLAALHLDSITGEHGIASTLPKQWSTLVGLRYIDIANAPLLRGVCSCASFGSLRLGVHASPSVRRQGKCSLPVEHHECPLWPHSLLYFVSQELFPHCGRSRTLRCSSCPWSICPESQAICPGTGGGACLQTEMRVVSGAWRGSKWGREGSSDWGGRPRLTLLDLTSLYLHVSHGATAYAQLWEPLLLGAAAAAQYHREPA